MNKPMVFIRFLFTVLSILLLTAFSVSSYGYNLSNLTFGLLSGLAFSCILIGIDYYILRRSTLRIFNTALLGLFCGYLMGEAVLLILEAAFGFVLASFPTETLALMRTIIYLTCVYLGMVLVARASDTYLISIPFMKFKNTGPKKKDIVLDWSILMDSRVLDIASSGLLDEHLIVPQFALNELYVMLENSDEVIKGKARRCLDVLKKLEGIPTLEMRYSDIDFAEFKDPASKLIQLARTLDANIITADVARLQQYAIEGIRIINIHMLTNVLRPMTTGEQLQIKIQRYGKEPRQGVGYLEDGTMVVVNGGAEYLGETIKVQVLSVKHTSSGRMIFCNTAEDAALLDAAASYSAGEINGAPKSFYNTI